MIRTWAWSAQLAALGLAASAGTAAGQTLIVRNAPPTSAVELVVNRSAVATATTDSFGDATLAAPAGAWARGTAAFVYVDACSTLQRVLVVDRAVAPPPPQALCNRRQVSGVFWVEPISTLVVDVGRSEPTLLLRQGPPPAAWLSREPSTFLDTGASLPGLVLFGGGGIGAFRDVVDFSCGNASPCSGDGPRTELGVGIAYWFTSFLGVEAAYLRPRTLGATGSGGTFDFDTSLEANVLTLAGSVGVPLGRVRLYGQVGANRHRATLGTIQTTDWVIFNADGSVQSLGSGTQTFDVRTSGWGLLVGGGIETWFTRSLGLFIGAKRLALKGTDLDEGEGAIDDRLLSMVVGARIRIGGGG